MSEEKKERVLRGQKALVVNHMKEHGTITPLEAETLYSIHRLAAVVFDLKKLGYDVTTNMVYTTNKYGEPAKYARYYLKGEKVR